MSTHNKYKQIRNLTIEAGIAGIIFVLLTRTVWSIVDLWFPAVTGYLANISQIDIYQSLINVSKGHGTDIIFAPVMAIFTALLVKHWISRRDRSAVIIGIISGIFLDSIFRYSSFYLGIPADMWVYYGLLLVMVVIYGEFASGDRIVAGISIMVGVSVGIGIWSGFFYGCIYGIAPYLIIMALSSKRRRKFGG